MSEHDDMDQDETPREPGNIENPSSNDNDVTLGGPEAGDNDPHIPSTQSSDHGRAEDHDVTMEGPAADDVDGRTHDANVGERVTSDDRDVTMQGPAAQESRYQAMPPRGDEDIAWVHAQQQAWRGGFSGTPTATMAASARPKRSFWSGKTGAVSTVVVAAIVAAATSYGVVHLTGAAGRTSPVVLQEASASPTALQGKGIDGGLNVPQILAKVEPAVVDLTARGVETSDTQGVEEFEDAGTGMIISPSGLVLTNNHVIEDATTIHATLYNQTKSYPVRVVGTDPKHDVALLQIEGLSHLPTVTFGNSSEIQVGDPVVAIGNALDLPGTPTVTQGIVSALNRSITASTQLLTEHLTGMIQTDAPINPGNSGGPLVNALGQVVGMDTAIIASTSSTPAQSLGFAESINGVVQVIRNIESNHNYYNKPGSSLSTGKGAFLGVVVSPLNAQTDLEIGYPPNQKGALVDAVDPGSAAASAGIEPEDVIVSFDGKSITTVTQLVDAVQSQSPGARATVGVLTPTGSQQTDTVSLGTAPAN